MLPDERPAPIYLFRLPPSPRRAVHAGDASRVRRQVGGPRSGRKARKAVSAVSIRRPQREGYDIGGGGGGSGKREETGDKRHEKRSVPGKAKGWFAFAHLSFVTAPSRLDAKQEATAFHLLGCCGGGRGFVTAEEGQLEAWHIHF